MIRPQWLSLRHGATALSAKRAAASTTCSFTSSRSGSSATGGDGTWPLLKKRNRHQPDNDALTTGGSLIDSLKSRQEPMTAELATEDHDAPASSARDVANTPSKKSDSRVMLVLEGLSPNLNASDFYRLAPNDLASWQSVIKKVQQQRNPTTFEPLGRYHISFATATAAISYRDRLIRLHRLSRHKLQSPNGLWESSVPAFLRASDGITDPATELETFTVVPGSRPRVDISRKRVPPTKRWTKQLADIVRKFDYGDKPPVVMLHVYPPTLTAADMTRFINEDGLSRGCKWKVGAPQHLEPLGLPAPPGREKNGGANNVREGQSEAMLAHSQSHIDVEQSDKLRSRFVVVCANEAEARRFHRQWNQKTVTAGTGATESRNLVNASIINW